MYIKLAIASYIYVSMYVFCVGIILFDEDASQPVSVENGVMRVRIGTTAYIVDGYTVEIVCKVSSDVATITIIWLRNGEPFGEDTSLITVTDASHEDTFTCRVKNAVTSKEKDTQIIFVHRSNFCIAK